MKKIIVLGAILASLSGFAQSKKELKSEVSKLKAQITELEKEVKVDMEDEKQKLSYALGANIAQSLMSQGLDDLDTEVFLKGMNDAKNDSSQMSDQEAQMVIQTVMQKKQEAKAEEATKEGREFLAKNATREEVTVTPSGLQYEVLVEGNGPKPTSSDKVKVHYHGTLLDGTVFDSSVSRGEPIEFPVTGVIQGWVEALQLMPMGSKWKLYIPYDLAYGERGAGGKIGPYSTLIFEVELLEVIE